MTIICAMCGKPAVNRVQNISRRNKKVLTDNVLCARHVQVEIILASTPDLGMTDIEILPLDGVL